MKKTVQNLFTLVIAVLLIINTLPSMVYADEEIPAEDPSQAQVEVISETGNKRKRKKKILSTKSKKKFRSRSKRSPLNRKK